MDSHVWLGAVRAGTPVVETGGRPLGVAVATRPDYLMIERPGWPPTTVAVPTAAVVRSDAGRVVLAARYPDRRAGGTIPAGAFAASTNRHFDA
jgi:hypothetical protein